MKRRTLPYLLFLVTSITSFGLHAQSMLTGTVKSAAGEPLAGASILIKNTTSGTTAGADGAFSLPLDDKLKNSVLVISFIGYISQEVATGARSRIDVVLQEDATRLGEVVVTGYTVQERGKITGAVNTLGEELIGRLPVRPRW